VKVVPRGGEDDSIANELQCEFGNNEGCEKDRQEPFSGASEAMTSPRRIEISMLLDLRIADLQGMTPRVDWNLDCAVHFDGSAPLASTKMSYVLGEPPLRLLMRDLEVPTPIVLLISRSESMHPVSPFEAACHSATAMAPTKLLWPHLGPEIVFRDRGGRSR